MGYISYKKIAGLLGINKGDILHISSDITRLAYDAMENGEKFDANIFIDTFIDAVGESGTIFFSTYSWDFCQGKPFDYLNTKGKTGFLGNAALKREDFKRTKHPIYSFAVWGKDKEFLCGLENTDSFGLDSPFKYLDDNRAKSISIDVHFNSYYTFCHYVEQQVDAPFRFMKYFNGTYIDETGGGRNRKYSMFVKSLELKVGGDASKLYDLLLAEKIAEERIINDITYSIIDIHESYEPIAKDLTESSGKLQCQYIGQDVEKVARRDSMFKLCSDLFPINRSLSGQGVRDTLNYIKNVFPELEIHEVKSGTEVFDWTVPEEWNIREAYIANMHGEKIIDIKNHNLHLMGYSVPINKVMTFKELDEHLYSIEEEPDAIPYVTSYYKRNWGFCLPHRMREIMGDKPDEKYRVCIDSDLNPSGVINYGDALIVGGGCDREILLSTYICHPSMGNNELSGIAVATEIGKYIKSIRNRKYNYRIVFAPETIGSLIYLNKYLSHFKANLEAGFVLSCLGDEGNFSCIHSPYGNNAADKIANHILKYIGKEPKHYSFLSRGSDERQYCAPLANLPVCTLTKTKFNEYREYHTSMDDLTFISPRGLEDGFEMVKRCVDLLELNEKYVVTCVGEPKLDKRGLYPTTSTRSSGIAVRALMNMIAYADGKNDLIDIAEIIGVNALDLKENLSKMVDNKLLRKV